MGNYRSDNRKRESRPNSRFDGRLNNRRFNNRPKGRNEYGRDRNFRENDKRPREMYDTICDKCKKECQVPFRPSGNKPILCSNCFKNEDSSRDNFSPKNQNNQNQSGMSSEQFNTLNKKLDKILSRLQELEIDEEYDDDEEYDEDEDDEDNEDEDNEDEDNDQECDRKKKT